MILCLSNARSGDLHFGVSFVALRALVREIIPNTGCLEKKFTREILNKIRSFVCTHLIFA